MSGYTGKILRVDLTARKISIIDTRDYEQWGGGNGIGSAIFFDLVKDKKIGAFDPGNVITIMTSPLSGTPVPSASSRTEVQGIAPEGYPIEWFTRSNFGGRFAAMLKYAGWDGIVLEGKADKPVWIDIRDRTQTAKMGVEIKDGGWLWGLDTWETQIQIWQEVSIGQSTNGWWKPGDISEDSAPRTTQMPAVLTTGPAGENLCRSAILLHDAGNAAGQGGFGAVFGSKNLKAISVIGTGNVKVADPKALLKIRMHGNYAKKPKQLRHAILWSLPEAMRFVGCTGCNEPCKGRYEGLHGNESMCVDAVFSALFTQKDGVDHPEAEKMGADLAQRYGLNVFALFRGVDYLRELNKIGVLGRGKKIDCDLPFDKAEDVAFAEKLIEMISYRKGIGADLAEGFPRAAEKWGRIKEDLNSGILRFPYWGYAEHGSGDPRAEVCWGYSTILSGRDCNEHSLVALSHYPTGRINKGIAPEFSAKEFVEVWASYLYPYQGDPRMLDFSTENIYSEHMVKLVSWHRNYDRFWKNSALYCDVRFPYGTPGDPNEARISFEALTKFWNAVTGKKWSFVDGMNLGKKIWNLNNAIWTLQGRHRDMVHFADYIYENPIPSWTFPRTGWAHYMPGIQNGEWKYLNLDGRRIDRDKFEEFKTKYYTFEGWDPDSGWPKRSTLESLGLSYVADELEKQDRLGKG